ncbi:MAG: hypothetical protein GTO18_13290 [Anaerolineales bacterium]|nr:hypothetical protein [Anaerolineales bacterium]
MAEKSKEEQYKMKGYYLPEETRDHLRAAHQAWRSSIEGLFPESFIENRRIARREFLLAARSFIDHAIERLDKPETA